MKIDFIEILNFRKLQSCKIDFSEKDMEEILKNLIHDKKNEYGKIQFALLDGIGGISLNQYFENKTRAKSPISAAST